MDAGNWESDENGKEWQVVRDNGQEVMSDTSPVWLEESDVATDIPALDKISTREGWLEEAARLWEEYHANQLSSFKRPREIFISIGKGLRESAKSLGSCHNPQGRDASYIYIRSDRHDACDSVEVLSTLFHELAHAYSPGAGHRGKFIQACKALGLQAGKNPQGNPLWTQAGLVSDESQKLAREVVLERLGKIPHAQEILNTVKKQSTRMGKASCPSCGYTVRLARKWAEYGMPLCPICRDEDENPMPMVAS